MHNMQVQTVRTSFSFPSALYQHLSLAAQIENRSLSDFVRELLTRAMEQRLIGQNKKIYQSLSQLDGVGDDQVVDASQTINKTLYE